MKAMTSQVQPILLVPLWVGSRWKIQDGRQI